MNNEKRNKRLRLLIARLNKERKRQAQKIDILCNDLVDAQREFIKSLKVISFSADFYEAIAGLTDLNELLCTAGNLLKDEIENTNIAFFLLQSNSFEMHIFESDQPIDLEDKRIENFFTTELVDNIAKSNHICTIDDMLAMGLQGNPRYLEKIAAVGLPINHRGCSLGLALLYRPFQKPFTIEELKSISQISTGLARCINACRASVASI